jgi:putative addiction module CopG family antidote
MPASYSLGVHFETFVRRQLKSGRFASASEVVREGLRLMEEREAERDARLEALRGEIAHGRAGGPGVPAEGAVARACARIDRESVLRRLRAHEVELKAMGISRLSLFGSVARGEETPVSDVDLAAEFDPPAEVGLLKYGAISHRLEELLGVKVDLVGEPIEKPRLRARVDRDRISVF